MKQNVEDIKFKEAKDMLGNYGFECCDFDAFIASLGIDCIEVIPPINSTVCCVKRVDKQWAAFEYGDKNPIVNFGKYNHMWGFDSGYCLVSVADKDRTTFANRGIIDSHGNEVLIRISGSSMAKIDQKSLPLLKMALWDWIEKNH